MLKSSKPGVPEQLFGGLKAPGKGGASQTLAPGQKDSITGADPLARMMGHYGKTPPAYLGPSPTPVSPSAHPAMNEIRGQSGGIKKHPKEGGIGPGPEGAVGPATPSAKDPDET
jgi:hypothetical protein